MTTSLYIKGFDAARTRILLARGVPGQDMPTKRTKINVADSLVKIEPDIPNSPIRNISVVKQLKVLQSLLDHPLRSSYTVGISSFPSDLRAKYLAIMIMNAAIDAYKDSHKPGRGLPLWHRVYGGYSDTLRDKPIAEMPCMLVITNVGPESTPMKLEKVRDLLEKFSDIPRIVVTGKDPPCSIFANRLQFPMKAGFYIGPFNHVREE